MKRCVWWLVLALLSSTAYATGYFRHADALEQLRLAYGREDPAARAAYFRGYVAGVADVADVTHQKMWCISDQMNDEKIYAVVSAHLKDHPAAPDRDAATLVTAALRDSFPCRTQ